MRSATLFVRVLAVGLPLTWLVGCDPVTDSPQDASNSGTAWEQSTNLTSEYGGYDFTAEPPAFGDPEVQAIGAEESPVVVSDPESLATQNAFALRILWGQLRTNRDAQQVTDWSGRITVTSGGFAVLRTIAFEYPGDHLLLPRENRQTLGFVSHTRPSFDGLLLLVRDPGDPTATLRFETGPFTGSWTFAELRDIDTVIPVDAVGNAVALQGIPADSVATCPNGVVRGRWRERDGERGVFRGLWATAFGRPVGHIRGHFGVNDQGERLWFGKIIDRDGLVIGLARGTWEPSTDPARPGGAFSGHWMGRGGERQGGVAGHFMAARETEYGVAGYFQGRWRTACDEPVPATP
jgi:hypothetical protein